MIAVVALGLVAAFVAGACVEARRHSCPSPDASLLAGVDQAKAMAREWAREAERRGRVARYWRREAQGHAAVLAALGRVVAEGGSVAGPVVDPRHPSQRRDEAA